MKTTMKKTGMRNSKKQLPLAIGMICLYSHLALGAVIFERNGNDLTMQITESISFEITATGINDLFGVSFMDAYSSDQGHVSGGALSPWIKVPIKGITNDDSRISQGYSVGDLTTKNINFSLFDYVNLENFTSGEIVVVPSGTFTATDYFSDVDATLPDREITSAFFWKAGGTRISNVVAVPEPATAGMLAISGLVFYAIRRIKNFNRF